MPRKEETQKDKEIKEQLIKELKKNSRISIEELKKKLNLKTKRKIIRILKEIKKDYVFTIIDKSSNIYFYLDLMDWFDTLEDEIKRSIRRSRISKDIKEIKEKIKKKKTRRLLRNKKFYGLII